MLNTLEVDFRIDSVNFGIFGWLVVSSLWQILYFPLLSSSILILLQMQFTHIMCIDVPVRRSWLMALQFNFLVRETNFLLHFRYLVME